MVRRPTIGDPAPEVVLTTTEGARWRLADRRGRTVLLIFHRHLH